MALPVSPNSGESKSNYDSDSNSSHSSRSRPFISQTQVRNYMNSRRLLRSRRWRRGRKRSVAHLQRVRTLGNTRRRRRRRLLQ
jgi:hypothetical protein